MPLFDSIHAFFARLLGEELWMARNEVALVKEGARLEQLVASGRLPEAEELAVRALDRVERDHGPDHPLAALACMNRATVCMARGDKGTAKKLVERALDITRRQCGEKHPATIQAEMKLVRWYQADGQLPIAQRICEGVLARCKEILGAEDSGLAPIYNCLASLYLQQKLYALAHTSALNAVHLSRKTGRHESVVGLMLLADALKRQGNSKGSLQSLELALEACVACYGEDSLDVARCRATLAVEVQDHRDFPRAEQLLKKALEIQQRLLGPSAPDFLDTVVRLGKLRFDEGRHEEGLILVAKVMNQLESDLGEAHAKVQELKKEHARLSSQMHVLQRAPGLEKKTRQLIEQLGRTPEILQELLDDLPPERRCQRLAPMHWSASDHVWAIAVLQSRALELLDSMLTAPGLSIEPGDELDEAREPVGSVTDQRGYRKRFLTERQALLERLNNLQPVQWQIAGRHPNHCRFSVLLLVQQLVLRELHHVYRIGEILLAR